MRCLILVVAIVAPAVLYYKLKIRGLVGNTEVVSLEQAVEPLEMATIAQQLDATEHEIPTNLWRQGMSH